MSIINITSFGSAGDGDDTQAIADAIASVPGRQTGWASSGDRHHGAYVIYLPETAPGISYKVSSTIAVPTKNIVFRSDARSGARLEWTGTPGDPMFRLAGGGVRRTHVFENLVFDGAGVAMSSDARFWTGFRECVFVDVPGKCIYTEGGSVVGGEVYKCQFWDCGEAVAFDHDACDIWQIWQPFVVRCSGVGITLKTSGVLVYDGNFEQKAVGAEAYPHIWIAFNGLQKIIGNRFAPETGAGGANPPRECIVIGESLTASGSSTFSRIRVEGNSFQGANTGPSATIANYAIRLNNPVERSFFDNNDFRAYSAGIVQENHSGFCRRVSWKNNKVIDGHTVPTFSAGGVEWDRDDFPRGMSSRETTNLLGHTENLAGWIPTKCSVAKDATGPDGVANSAHTITKTATGTSHIRHQLAGTASGETLVFSCRVKSVDATQVSLRIYSNTAAAWLSDINLNTTIADEHDGWRQIVLRVRPTAGHTLTAYLAIEATGSALGSGSFEVAELQLEEGYEPTPYLPTYDANLRTRPGNAKMVGGSIVSSGTAAPGSGYWRQGDEVLYSNPSASGKRGAVCVTSGTPGTWKEWGAIDA